VEGGSFAERAEAVIRSLPQGEVVTYGEVAREAGRPGAARAVGHLLATTAHLPWWRVVAANGRLVPGHEAEHSRRLQAEGVTVVDGRVRFSRRRPGQGRG
jgi:methylated-DNA-protein-cysteine methyltransferase-like protein